MENFKEASCCAPTCRQLLLLQQDGVGHTQLGQVVQGLAAKTAPTWIICNEDLKTQV